jgi:hypothetical protein
LSTTSSSTSWLDPSSSSTSTADQYLALDSSLSNAVDSALTSSIQGEGSLAGQEALNRVDAEVAQKQATATSSTATAPSSTGSGYATVQNLMSALDNITINGGSAPAASTSSAGAASGYTAVQNLMSSLDNITMPSGTTPATTSSGGSALAQVDSILASPLPVNVTA